MDGYERELGALGARVEVLGTSLAEIRQEALRGHHELKQMIKHLGGRIDAMRDEHTKGLRALEDGHDVRITALERWRFLTLGGLMLLGFVLGTPAVVRLIAMTVSP